MVLLASYDRTMTTTLSNKGQIVLPKSIRTANRWAPGTKFIIEAAPGGVLLRPARRPRAESVTLDAVIGCTGYSGPKHSTADMNAGIAREARRAWTAAARRSARQ